MRIDEVKITGFGGYGNEEIFDLSNKLTVVVGANGSGKSSIYEAASAAMFQKSIRSSRGVKMFHDAGGHVEVLTSGGTFSVGRGANQGAFKNPQPCTSVSFDRWRLGTVFERGAWIAAPAKLLEMISAILDLEKINKAHDKVRKVALEADKQISSLSGSIATTKAQIEKFNADAQAVIPEFDAKLLKKYEKEKTKWAELDQQAKVLIAKRQDVNVEIRKVPKELKECPTCKRPFDITADSCRDDLLKGFHQQVADINAKLEELDHENVQAKLHSVKLKLRALEESRATADRARAVAQAAQTNAVSAAESLLKLEQSLTQAQAQALLFKEALRVLGPKGLPGFLLETELEAVSEAAAEYAAEINPSAQLAVEYGEKGIVIDARYGAANYDSCSEGEKRAVDLALFFAFAAIANHGGTVFLDEAFDCLDEECAYRAIRLCDSLPFNVVILTHSENVLGAVANAKIYTL